MKFANDNTPDLARLVEQVSQTNRAWLTRDADFIQQCREEDRRNGIIWHDEQEKRA